MYILWLAKNGRKRRAVLGGSLCHPEATSSRIRTTAGSICVDLSWWTVGWLFRRLSPRVSLASQYLSANLDTNRKLVRHSRVQTSSLDVLWKILVQQWSLEQLFCRAESRKHIGEYFINYNPEWILKESVLPNFFVCIPRVFSWVMGFDNIVQHLCFALKKWACLEQYEWSKKFLWKSRYILQVFLAGLCRIWLCNENVDNKAKADCWCFDFCAVQGVAFMTRQYSQAASRVQLSCILEEFRRNLNRSRDLARGEKDTWWVTHILYALFK